jgi:branched-chain amino acid transport system substrate-binding protein
MTAARIAVLRLIGRPSAAKKPLQAGSELSGTAMRRVPYTRKPHSRLGETPDRQNAPAGGELVQKRARCCNFRRGRAAVGRWPAGAVRMRGHDVPEQDALLQAELAEDTVDDRRARLSGAGPRQLPLRGEGESADSGATIASGFAHEQNWGASALLQVRGKPLSADRRVRVLVERGADARLRQPRCERGPGHERDCRLGGMRLLLVLAALLLVVGLPGAYGRNGGDPGVTDATILLGGTVPLTGDAVAYAALARGAEAYFKYVNSRGGVRGRKIQYLYVDDAYNPTETVRKTRQLVQDEHVFAIFNSVGTEHALAVRPYLNQATVPQLFVGSGVSALALEHKRYPWSMGYLPRFAGEGALYGRYLARTRPRARIAVLHEDSEYGQDMFAGLRRGLGRLTSRITAVQTYSLADTDLNAQIARLKASGADTIMVFALPTQTIQAFLAIHKLGWRPRIFVNSVSIDPFVMEVVQRNTSKRLVEGALSSSYLKDPTDPALANDSGVKLYKQILRRYLPSAKVKEVAHLYGMAVAFTMVDALRGAGQQPTRKSLLRAATHLNERSNPFFVRGIAVQTGPDDYYPVERTRMLRFHAGRWRQLGGLVSVR